MKTKKIVGKDIKRTHPQQKGYPTDAYYQRMANLLLDNFYASGVDVWEHTDEVYREAAIVLTNYMEDIVADSGPWRMFSNECQRHYGQPIPMYHQEEEYYTDEPSLNAVRYLIWSVVSELTDDIVYDDSTALDRMAERAYHILDELFDEAPINNQLADDIGDWLDVAMEDFNSLRMVLTWLYNDCYITRGLQNEELLKEKIEEAMQLEEHDLPMSPAMAIYFANMQCLFAYQIGPLALYAKDYLALLMRERCMNAPADDVENIERLDTGIYKYRFITPQRLLLTRTNGKQIEIQASELNFTQKMLHEHDGCMATSFIHYQGEWHLNGIIIPMPGTAERWNKLCEDDAENLKPGTQTLTAERMLDRTGGQRIVYFADREELKNFLEKKIKFPRKMLGFIDEQGGDLPTLFIDDQEPKNCLQFFFDASPCIADPNNPFYDREEAQKHAVDLLWNGNNATTHAVQYLLEHNYLPDVYTDKVFSKLSTHEQTRADIDFLMRFWRRKDY